MAGLRRDDPVLPPVGGEQVGGAERVGPSVTAVSSWGRTDRVDSPVSATMSDVPLGNATATASLARE